MLARDKFFQASLIFVMKAGFLHHWPEFNWPGFNWPEFNVCGKAGSCPS